MSLFLLRPAVVLLATLCTCPGPAHAEVASNGMVFGPDSNGVCYEGYVLPEGIVVPCPNQVHGHLPKSAVAGIAVAVVFVIVLLVILLLWRRQVRATTDDSASSLFDFVPAGTTKTGTRSRRPSSPQLSIQTMVGSQNEKEGGSESPYFNHGSNPMDVEAEGSVETLT
ncbi:hypothetical protein BT96DRAFT_920518 [Gymnopus androsaceus JB14]|uniref:Uncharacterized protein n=1 Tax=Gymnopus androsaceus JB14 TaxID=1447944 RepID=A0A6A4HPG1_9AGAR|nr:hypothetical protein BT96DRAFT_920518 [Gymnopus androsaceus JB14]